MGDDLQAVSAALGDDGHAKSSVELPGQAGVPMGSMLVMEEGTQSLASYLPQVSQLPAVASFRLRLPSLGLITRLRSRYGCTVSEMCGNELDALLSLLLKKQ